MDDSYYGLIKDELHFKFGHIIAEISDPIYQILLADGDQLTSVELAESD